MKFLALIFDSNTTGSESCTEFYKVYKHGRLTWLIESSSKRATFLKIYSASTSKAKIYKILINLIWFLGLQSLFFSKQKFNYSGCSIYARLKKAGLNDIAFFTGTVGDNRKAVFYGQLDSKGYYCKFPLTYSAKKLVQSELRALLLLQNINCNSIIIPTVIQCDQFYLMSDVSNYNSKVYSELDERAFIFSNEMCDKSLNKLKLHDISDGLINESFALSIESKLNELKNEKLKSELIVLVRMAKILVAKYSDESIECTFAHGDFTPWNSYSNGDDIAIIDWEMFGYYPVYFDLIHYIVSKNVLLGKFSDNSLSDDLLHLKSKIKKYNCLSLYSHKFASYVRLYALTNAMYYGYKFSLQDEDIHEQAFFLIRTWIKLMDYDD